MPSTMAALFWQSLSMDSSFQAAWFIIAVLGYATGILCSLIYFYRVHLSPLSKFPGPKMAAFTRMWEGYHVLFKDDWMQTLTLLHQKYGPIVRIGPNELHMTDGEWVLNHHRQVDLQKCQGYYGILSTLLGGLASPTSHRARKALMQPLFRGTILSNFTSTTLDEFMEVLLCRIAKDGGLPPPGTDTLKDNESTRKSDPINLTYALWAFTNDVMGAYLFGNVAQMGTKGPQASAPGHSDYFFAKFGFGFLANPDLKAVHDKTRSFGAIDLATLLRSFKPAKMLLDAFPVLRTQSPLAWLDDACKTELLRALNVSTNDCEPRNIIGKLYRLLGDDRKMMTTVIQEASQAIFIGNESLLSNITHLLHCLVANPHVIEKLRKELDSLDTSKCGWQVWRHPDVTSLKYLNAVVKESTRLSPPSWHRQPRQVDTTVDYKGRVIPAKTSLSFTLRMLQRDPALYADPEAFIPERWLAVPAPPSAVFGTGSRTCLGQYIATMVLLKTAAAFVSTYDFEILPQPLHAGSGLPPYLVTYPRKVDASPESCMHVRLQHRI